MADDDDKQCPNCGSSLADRQNRALKFPDDTIPLSLLICPHCDAEKCCMCDMGDDVECGSCPDED